ncbi:MAG: hypothetical protein JST78_09695 [Bacteroidetes bacterium]|nr:hypothetical protein [Bacteroidota bacterium]
MKKQIHELLGFTPEQYGNYIERLWLNWAEARCANNPIWWQNIISSPSINRWFNAELEMNEQRFIQKVRRYENADTITTVDYVKCYSDCVNDIFNIYPKPLIDAAKPKNLGEVYHFKKIILMSPINRN